MLTVAANMAIWCEEQSDPLTQLWQIGPWTPEKYFYRLIYIVHVLVKSID